MAKNNKPKYPTVDVEAAKSIARKQKSKAGRKGGVLGRKSGY